MYNWIDKHKDDDNAGINFLKVMYAIGKTELVYSIIVTLLGIFIPLMFEWDIVWLAIIFIIILICFIIFNAVCSQYQKRKYQQRKLASDVLDNQSSLINTLNIEVKSNPQWKANIFKKFSEIVCEKIQHMFKEILKCDTRVSIEYVFDKNIKNKSEKYVKMSGRRSPNRDTCKKSTSLESRNKYFSYRVFTDNKTGINILSEDDINKGTYWYKNPSHRVDIKQYIGIAISVLDDNRVDYILQIDCLSDITFGKNNTDEDIELFINQYLKSYINIVSLSYLLNLNKYKQIPEV